jgi:hypothetical protein
MERASLGGGTSSGSPDELIELAQQVGRSLDRRVRDELAALYSAASILQWSMQRAQGGESRLGALVKLQYSEHARRMTTAALGLVGSSGMAWAGELDDESTTVWQDRFLFCAGIAHCWRDRRDSTQHHRRTNPRPAERASPRCAHIEARVHDHGRSATVWSQ